jgi:hypothetical protein
MTSVAEYHQAVKARLIADPLIVRFEIRRERRSVDDGHLRACLMLHNSSGRLIRRWDNAPHFSHLPQAPHHIHDGDKGKVLPGSPRTIVEVLDEIADIIASKDR